MPLKDRRPGDFMYKSIILEKMLDEGSVDPKVLML